MKLAGLPVRSGRTPRLLAFASLLLLPAAYASAQTSGVSNPPPNDTITADESVPAQTSSAPTKPMPGEPVAYVPGQAPAAQPAAAATTAVTAGPPAAASAAQPVENPDYGIVTSTSEPASTPNLNPGPDSGYNAKLVSRPTNPDFGIVDVVPSGPNELAEGTDIHTRLLDPLSTTRTEDGQLFRAQISQDVYKDGRVVIPVGSELRGRVVGVTQGHRLGSRATIRLRPEDVLLPDGTAYHLYAQAVGTMQPGTRTDDEGGIQAAPHYAKDATEYGAGAGGGAIVGGVFGGPVGAGAGAIVGAGIVTTHMLLQRPEQAQLERGSEVVFSLTEPMQLLATKN